MCRGQCAFNLIYSYNRCSNHLQSAWGFAHFTNEICAYKTKATWPRSRAGKWQNLHRTYIDWLPALALYPSFCLAYLNTYKHACSYIQGEDFILAKAVSLSLPWQQWMLLPHPPFHLSPPPKLRTKSFGFSSSSLVTSLCIPHLCFISLDFVGWLCPLGSDHSILQAKSS